MVYPEQYNDHAWFRISIISHGFVSQKIIPHGPRPNRWGRSSRFVTGADVQCSELVRISERYLPET
jgi:hypothetical protein